MEWLGLLVALAAGVALGLLGGGGSVLVVPALVYCFGRSPVEATAYSLVAVGSVSLVGAILCARRRPIPLRALTRFGGSSLVAAYLVRAFVVPALPPAIDFGFARVGLDHVLMLAFALFAGAAGLAMLRRRCCVSGPAVHPAWVPFAGIATGALTALLGAGGGFLVLPALVLLVGLPMEEAVGASLAVIAAQAISGSLGVFSSGAPFDVRFALELTATMLLGVAWGVASAGLIPPVRLRRTFGVFVVAVAAVMALLELA